MIGMLTPSLGIAPATFRGEGAPCVIVPFWHRSCRGMLHRLVFTTPDWWSRRYSACTVGRAVDTDELAIYGWINPSKSPEDVKRERHRMVALQTIRYGIQHQMEDIWQEWQLAVHQRVQTVSPLPVEQREFFTFGIARNLCRSYHRKDQRMIPLLDPSGAQEESAAGIRETELATRRSDRPSGPINKFSGPAFAPGEWGHGNGLKECINGLRPRAREILRKTYLDGSSSFEVGTEIGLSAENVRQQLRRARDELRRCLEARAGRQKGKDWKHAHLDK